MSLDALRKYYIAGPMTGIKGHNFEAFDAAAAALRGRGYTVVSPAEIARELPGEPGSLPYHEYVRADLRKLLDCTDLVLLPGWRNSRGAMRELDLAEFLHFRVWKIEADTSLVRTEYGDTRVG
ncbi:hypothetical protein TIN4_47 [Tsukamurella phage TIN4]|uniref:Nucleoside deoxyribosyltransferase n=2 Tax=Tinduovirus TIN3 TaxID=1982571 RepID=A0A0K0N629_9CAUD|nr:nucleoside 2-deoxyribosyltransferase [Tsukamurella phage TIN3]YP_009604177.1 nucleoside 2-deoxyribosyltransferase [Tsukamurella phage TIN4]AKJ71844.1 hypothetical protein TIN3_47 [Tsukamurella phage TIN3]AKJ71953.1 hypothetical protein TIN4_47 [Tsukamurella phage TIN4]